MIDLEPKSYKFKHPKHISLDGYNGIAAASMRLNDPVADRFMAVSDMRADIVVMQKPHDRVLDYDQLGFVRVAKYIKMPRLDIWRKKGLVMTKKEGNTWIVAIDDQGISDEITHGSTYGQFEEEFKARFWQETRNGLRDCLTREKLLNSGNYNLPFITGYLAAMPKEVMLYPLIAGLNLQSGELPHITFAKLALLYSVTHLAYNALNLTAVALDWVKGKIDERLGDSAFARRPMTTFHEPFIKNSLPDLLMPPVPLDRFVRGLVYLNKHGNEFIK